MDYHLGQKPVHLPPVFPKAPLDIDISLREWHRSQGRSSLTLGTYDTAINVQFVRRGQKISVMLQPSPLQCVSIVQRCKGSYYPLHCLRFKIQSQP